MDIFNRKKIKQLQAQISFYRSIFDEEKQTFKSKIQEKFYVGQDVYYLEDNQIEHREIVGVKIKFNDCTKYNPAFVIVRDITYTLAGKFKWQEKQEYELFATKEELLKTL